MSDLSRVVAIFSVAKILKNVMIGTRSSLLPLDCVNDIL